MSLRTRLLPLAALALAAAPALCLAAGGAGGPQAGHAKFDGIMGPAKDNHFQGWFDMTGHDITVEEGTPRQCTVEVDILATWAAPPFLIKVGDDFPTVELDLSTPNQSQLYRAKLEDAHVTKVVTSSDDGQQHEMVMLSPDSVQLKTKKIRPDGTTENGGNVMIECGVSRSP